ncbi:efflux transporter outer membrane subunit [Shewanella sp. UCD-KL12]|uniref:efflux transporter outer membrane subunit n=1 Tax=Shewanella sp. UCD-KL12 TaxID=1917163 RepID=UPI000970A960|nr:TolC family protein [Shewanella sp. UCD-KL12]
MKKSSLPLLISLLTLGCSVTPDYQVSETIPAGAIYLHGDLAEQGAQIEELWWKQFGDSELNLLIADVQNQNVSIQIGAQRIKAAQAYQTAVSSMKVPTISAGASAFSYGISEKDPLLGIAVSGITNPINGQQIELLDKSQEAYALGFNISWQADLFGKLAALDEAAKVRQEQAVILQQGVITLITADLIHNYLQYRGAQERLQIAERNIADQQSTLELVSTLVESGYGSSLDLSRAKAALAALKANSTALKTAERAHLYRIATLLGQHPRELVGRFNQAALPEVTGKIPLGLPSSLLKRRTDIALAEREMAAINHELGASIAGRYPDLYLTASPGTLAGNLDDLFSSGSSSWLAGIGLNWTLFDGGRTEAVIDIQHARFKQAGLRYQQTVNNAFNEVETSLMSYGNSMLFHQQLSEAASHSQIAVNKAKHLYKAGLIDHLQVLDAQRQQHRLDDIEVIAKLNIAANLVQLNKALGGDWQSSPKVIPPA